jgi:hypothetical protein
MCQSFVRNKVVSKEEKIITFGAGIGQRRFDLGEYG